MKETSINLPALKFFELNDLELKEVHGDLLSQLPEQTQAIGFCAFGVVVQNRRTGSYLVVGHGGEFVYLDYNPFPPLNVSA